MLGVGKKADAQVDYARKNQSKLYANRKRKEVVSDAFREHEEMETVHRKAADQQG